MSETHKKKKRRKVQPRFYVIITMFLVLILLLAFLIGFLARWACVNMGREEGTDPVGFGDFVIKGATPAPTPTPTPSPTPEPTPTPKPTPHVVAESNPEQYGFVPHLQVGGEFIKGAYSGGEEVMANSYRRTEEIEFPDADAYNAETVKGILTFRGNNWRNQSSCGTVELTENKLTKVWEFGIGSLAKGSGKGSWSGCGWTGQPLIVQWPAETRRIMNLYEWAKEKENLVEVIYPTEDGNIYFLDLETGKKTRDPITNLKVPFKGTGSIDPRGYPLLYCGSGDQYENDSQKSRAFIISLINGTVLYEFGKQGTDPLARRLWYAYDSAPLIDAKTDTLIYPGENGIIYTMKLNTVYDPALGSISVNPSNIVKFRYDVNGIYDDTDTYKKGKWQGYEGSAVAWNGYLYLSSNDGMFQCIDLNTMQCVWIANTEDDTNGSPVLDVISDDEAYLYVGTSLHFNQDDNNSGIAPFFRINAMTGEIESNGRGRYGLTVFTVNGVSGGIQATAAVGKKGSNIENLVFVTIARYPEKKSGVLVALDKNDFNHVVWEYRMSDYSWSSPTVVYNAAGKGYVIQADSAGRIFLFDAETGPVDGKPLYTISPTDTNFEASPAVFGNMLVVGCRGDMKIFGIRLS